MRSRGKRPLKHKVAEDMITASTPQFFDAKIPEHADEAVRKGVEIDVKFAFCTWKILVGTSSVSAEWVTFERVTYVQHRFWCTCPLFCCCVPFPRPAADLPHLGAVSSRPIFPYRPVVLEISICNPLAVAIISRRPFYPFFTPLPLLGGFVSPL